MTQGNSSDLKLLMFAKTRQMKTHQWVYKLLRDNLLCGRIQPGLALTIRGLSQLLKVSPMPVREALHRLSCEGGVEVKDNRRIIVPLMTAQKFNELCDLRILLESHAAQAVLAHIKPTHIDMLEQLDAKINVAVENHDVDNISLMNQEFHRQLYQINPHQISVPLIESLWLQLGPFSRIVVEKLKKVYLVDHHNDALEALKGKDSDALKQAIENDIRAGIASLNKLDDINQYFAGAA